MTTYTETISKVVESSVSAAIKTVEEVSDNRDMGTYFIASSEVLLNTLKISLENDVPSIRYFPLTNAFVSGIIFGAMNTKESLRCY